MYFKIDSMLYVNSSEQFCICLGLKLFEIYNCKVLYLPQKQSFKYK